MQNSHADSLAPGFSKPVLKRTIKIEFLPATLKLIPSSKAEGSHRDPELLSRPGKRRDRVLLFQGTRAWLESRRGAWCSGIDSDKDRYARRRVHPSHQSFRCNQPRQHVEEWNHFRSRTARAS